MILRAVLAVGPLALWARASRVEMGASHWMEALAVLLDAGRSDRGLRGRLLHAGVRPQIAEFGRYAFPAIAPLALLGVGALHVFGRRRMLYRRRRGAGGDDIPQLRRAAADADRFLCLSAASPWPFLCAMVGHCSAGMLRRSPVRASQHELLVCDSGSRDGSVSVARAHGARVLEIAAGALQPRRRRATCSWREARGAHVALLTQDAEPADERWLERLLGGFELARGRRDRLRPLPLRAPRPRRQCGSNWSVVYARSRPMARLSWSAWKIARSGLHPAAPR